MMRENMKLHIVQENSHYKKCLLQINLGIPVVTLRYVLYFKSENLQQSEIAILMRVSINSQTGCCYFYPITTLPEHLRDEGVLRNIPLDLVIMPKTSQSMENWL